MMKKLTAMLLVLTTLTLSGCSEVTPRNGADDEITSSTVESSVTSTVSTTESDISASVSKPVTSTTSSEKSSITSTATSSTTTSTTSERPVTTTTTSTPSTKTETSTPTTTSKPVENTPSTTTSTKTETSIEKLVETHTHNFSNATCDKPATCSCGATNGNALGHNFTTATCVAPSTCKTCGITKGTTTNHNFVNGVCAVCRKNDPNYVAPHNCKTDGHIWGDSYTEVETRTEEVIERHNVTGSGYDETLAARYFGKASAPTDYGIVGTCTADQDMKTTNTVNTTKYFHKCTKCGYIEMYNSTEEVIPSNVWERCSPRIGATEATMNTIWWDVNNIPADVVANSEHEQELIDEWFKTW